MRERTDGYSKVTATAIGAAKLEFDDRDVEKYRIVRELFIDTADDNYIVARWCYTMDLYLDFHWLAVHALEKYLKAMLLLNKRSSKEYRHDITKLYPAAKMIAGELLPKLLEKPPKLAKSQWYEETPEAFLKRLYKSGEANNRYMLFGYSHLHDDIYKLDRMVFSVRRLCDSLDKYYVPRHVRRELARAGEKNFDYTRREFLASQPDYWESVAGGRFADAANGSRGKMLRYVALNHNLAFAPPGFRHSRFRTSSAAHNPVLLRHVLDPLGKNHSDATRENAREICDWVIENIQLPRDVVAELNAAK